MAQLNLGQSKYWCFTINNPKPNYADLKPIKKWEYMVVGNEVGDNGTPHLQGFVIYQTRTRFATVKSQIPMAHIEKMHGTPQQASDYCKKDGNFEEFGTMPDYKGGATGGEKKAENYRRMIKQCEEGDLDTLKEENPASYFLHYSTVKRIQLDAPQKQSDLDELQNEWIWGKTGLGKSYMARHENPGYYTKTHNKQWNSYNGEKVAIIDDLSLTASNWIGEHLKQWADHYAFPADCKYSQKQLRPSKIVVTSNYSIEEMFAHDETLCEAVLRRFKVRHIIEPFPELKKIQESKKKAAQKEKEKDDSILSEDEPEDVIVYDPKCPGCGDYPMDCRCPMCENCEECPCKCIEIN